MKVKVGKRIATIENWTLCATTSLMNKAVFLDMITMEMTENPNLKFNISMGTDDVASKVIMGNLYNKPGMSPGCFVKTACIVSVKNGIATTIGGEKYHLGKMHPDYKMFVDCVNDNRPVLFNYVFGSDLLSSNGEIYVSGNVYVDGDIKYIVGEVEKQDFEKHSITVDGIEYFVNWMSMNEKLRKRFNPNPKSHVLNNIPINVDVENETFAGDSIYGKELNLFESEWDIDFMRHSKLFDAPKKLKFK